MQIGKGGVGENLVKTISDALEARELIKLTVLENSMESPRDVANELAEATDSDVVGVVGRKIILYRESVNNKRIEL
jgi:RNA-binding protein